MLFFSITFCTSFEIKVGGGFELRFLANFEVQMIFSYIEIPQLSETKLSGQQWKIRLGQIENGVKTREKIIFNSSQQVWNRGVTFSILENVFIPFMAAKAWFFKPFPYQSEWAKSESVQIHRVNFFSNSLLKLLPRESRLWLAYSGAQSATAHPWRVRTWRGIKMCKQIPFGAQYFPLHILCMKPSSI